MSKFDVVAQHSFRFFEVYSHPPPPPTHSRPAVSRRKSGESSCKQRAIQPDSTEYCTVQYGIQYLLSQSLWGQCGWGSEWEAEGGPANSQHPTKPNQTRKEQAASSRMMGKCCNSRIKITNSVLNRGKTFRKREYDEMNENKLWVGVAVGWVGGWHSSFFCTVGAQSTVHSPQS